MGQYGGKPRTMKVHEWKPSLMTGPRWDRIVASLHACSTRSLQMS